MPPALDRLLASPSAFCVLRTVVNAPNVPATCAAAARCCICCISRRSKRNYSNSGRDAPALKWKRWHDAIRENLHRNQVRHELEADLIWDDRNEDASWAATLARQERLRRQQGIRTIWKATRFRGYQLPVDDTIHARFLWGTFIKNPKLVEEVISHAAETLRRTGMVYLHLYESVMAYWLPREPHQALIYHHMLQTELNMKKLPLAELARIGRVSFKEGAYDALMKIYQNSSERDLYDETIPVLIQKGYRDMARKWHFLCTFRNDFPSEATNNYLDFLVLAAEMPATTIAEQPSADGYSVRNPKDSRLDDPSLNQGLLRKLAGRDTAPVRFDDTFCARMFATQAFPPASVIRGLALLGVNEIGPRAVLTMAKQTKPIQGLPLLFEQLSAAGIALRGCVFSIALEKFAAERKWQLVHSMLDTDQHPDVFDDVEVQKKLLEYYLNNADFVQAQRTLAILTLFHNDSSKESWNLLFQTQVGISGPQHINGMLNDMHSRNIKLTLKSLDAIKTILRPRKRGRKPGRSLRGRFDDLRFVARVYMRVLQSGMGTFPQSWWIEIIRRFGMMGRFKELRRLLLWLLRWYTPSSRQLAHLQDPTFQDSELATLGTKHAGTLIQVETPRSSMRHNRRFDLVRRLFAPSLQQGIVVWGFRAGLLFNAPLEQSMLGRTLGKKHYRQKLLHRQVLQRKSWSVGLKFLTELRDLGVTIHSGAILKALQAQFVVLFGHRRSKKRENRMVARSNTQGYPAYVKEVNRIWGSQLIVEPGNFPRNKLHQHLWHPRLPRQVQRPHEISLKQISGPGWQNHGEKSATDILPSKVESCDDGHAEELLNDSSSSGNASGSVDSGPPASQPSNLLVGKE